MFLRSSGSAELWHRVPMTNSPSPSVDFTGASLHAGQSVTFISTRSDEPRLYLGEIKLIGAYQLIVESGDGFFSIKGDDMSGMVGENVVAYRNVLGMPATGK